MNASYTQKEQSSSLVEPSEALLCVGGLIHTFVVCTRTCGDSFFGLVAKLVTVCD